MSLSPEKCHATKFQAEMWTKVFEREIWATVMLDGDEAGFPCAFGPKEGMLAYSKRLNDANGVLS